MNLLDYSNNNKNVVCEYEYGYLTEKHFPSDQFFYINVPKIMPNINRGKPKVLPMGIPDMLINSGECKPTISPIRPWQNYLYIERFENKDLEFKINTVKNGAPAIDIGTQMLIQFTDSNILVYHVAHDM